MHAAAPPCRLSTAPLQVQIIRIQLRVPEYGWTTQKVFHLLNFLVCGLRSGVFALRYQVQELPYPLVQAGLLDLPGERDSRGGCTRTCSHDGLLGVLVGQQPAAGKAGGWAEEPAAHLPALGLLPVVAGRPPARPARPPTLPHAAAPRRRRRRRRPALLLHLHAAGAVLGGDLLPGGRAGGCTRLACGSGLPACWLLVAAALAGVFVP